MHQPREDSTYHRVCYTSRVVSLMSRFNDIILRDYLIKLSVYFVKHISKIRFQNTSLKYSRLNSVWQSLRDNLMVKYTRGPPITLNFRIRS